MEQDWYSARVVAMVLATNSKRGKYEPQKWMAQSHRKVLDRARAAPAAPVEPMNDDQAMQMFKRLGARVVDLRGPRD